MVTTAGTVAVSVGTMSVVGGENRLRMEVRTRVMPWEAKVGVCVAKQRS